MMRFLVDEQLSGKLVPWFQNKSHQAEHVVEVLGVSADDRAIAAYAQRKHAIIVSKDFDFLDMADDDHKLQVLWIRTGNTRTQALPARLESDWGRIEAALADGRSVVELL